MLRGGYPGGFVRMLPLWVCVIYVCRGWEYKMMFVFLLRDMWSNPSESHFAIQTKEGVEGRDREKRTLYAGPNRTSNSASGFASRWLIIVCAYAVDIERRRSPV